MTDAAAPPPEDSARNVDAALALMQERRAWARENTVAAFEMLAERLAATPTMPQILVTLRRELHRVHGTAWGAGSGEASRLATAMETLAARWVDDVGLDHERRGTVVAQFARSLGEALANADVSVSDEATDAGAKRLLLMDLPDDVASGLVAEGVARGYRVERVNRAGIAMSLRREAPTLIVASEQALAPGEAAGVPRVLLRSSDSVDRQVAMAPGQRVLDPHAEAREILDVLDLLEQLSGAAAGKVCLVDDDPVVLALLRALVMRDGLDVATFSSADSLLDTLSEINPLLLVLDVDLRGTSGVELARQVRSAAWSDVPILMLSAHADVITRTAAFAAGADDYMVKPVVPTEFQRRINRLVEARRRQRLASGVHPATGLPLAARTVREIEARLRLAGKSPVSVFVIRPYATLAAAPAVSAWMVECVRLARAVQGSGGIAGFVDDIGLGGVVPMGPWEVSELLVALVGDAPEGTSLWQAGVAGLDGHEVMTPRALLDAAETACLAARDSAVPARVWDPEAFDVAPDVVVVESDDALAEMLAFALEARGLTHRRFATGPSALDAMLLMRPRGHTPIVMLEVDLPGLDGHSLHERLRVERPDMFDVVFLSVHASEPEQLRAFQGGALDYVTKPFSLRVLMAKLTSWQSRRRRA